LKTTLGTPRYRPPTPAIRLGQSDRQPNETRYGRFLVWYMRALAVLWFLQGAWQWWSVLTATGTGSGVLETMTPMGVTAVVFFCVADFICAVGLWLAAPWGGVVWLVTVAARWLTAMILPNFFDHDLATGLAALVLVIGYFGLTYQAAREEAPFV
jgi:hypothetical protein